MHACRQVIGNDFHASAIIGAQNLKADAGDFGIDAEWVDTEAVPDQATSGGKALDPTAVVFNSEHVSLLLLTSSYSRMLLSAGSP